MPDLSDSQQDKKPNPVDVCSDCGDVPGEDYDLSDTTTKQCAHAAPIGSGCPECVDHMRRLQDTSNWSYPDPAPALPKVSATPADTTAKRITEASKTLHDAEPDTVHGSTTTTAAFPAHIAPGARWGWLTQRGTESPEDAKAAQTIVRAFQLMQTALDDRQRTIEMLFDEIERLEGPNRVD